MRSLPLTIRPLARFLVTLPLALAVAGCSTEPDVPDFYQVTYHLTNMSLGSIDQLTFIDDLRVTQTVEDPSDGWEVQFLIPAGHPIGATAEGTVQSGEIVLTIRVVGATGEFTRSDSCEELAGQLVACSLEIPRENL
jgi:hypothetical protein